MEIVTIKRLGFRYANSGTDAADAATEALAGRQRPKAACGANALADVSLNVRAGEFLVICGRSGSGKTTLLRHLKPQLSPHGEMSGEILFAGEPLAELDERSAAAKIGFVAQSPEGQLVTDKVWHELAFGLESLGVPTAEIRRRVAETASFFGIQNWFREDVSGLSGGQKQLLNLAAAMVTQPELLILDEPTSRLDPIAAAEFLAMLKKINDELGTTIILSEHRLEAALPLASRVVVMENGSVLCKGGAAEVGKLLKEGGSGMFRAMPAAVRIREALDPARECPVSVNEGRAFLREFIAERGVDFVKSAQKNADSESSQKSGDDGVVGNTEAVELRGGWFKYERGLPDVLRGCDFRARFGEIVCVVGGNGAGKSTLLKILAGVKKPQRGAVKRHGKVCLLPQEPRLLFSKKTVADELSDALSSARSTDGEKLARITETAARCGLSELLERHPYDLSGGETQRAALAKLLLAEPQVLLLDEPTQGLDAEAKASLAELLRGLAAEGVCVVAVSHDIEFCAELATRCALFFDGAIVSDGSPREFFSGNSFYTTAAHRISRGFVDGAVTVEDVAESFLGETPNAPRAENRAPRGETADLFKKPNAPKNDTYYNMIQTPLPLWRKLCAAALVCLTAAAWATRGRKLDFSALIGAEGVTAAGWRVFALFGLGICCFGAAALLIRGGKPLKAAERSRKITRRSVVIALILTAAVAATVWLGAAVFPRRAYYLTATAILLECMAACFIGAFSQTERHGISARRLAVIAVLCALGVAGRAAFFWLPQVKPVLAICILAGVGLGGEAGFTVGAVTMLVSNIMFGQGPWTPWQMTASGVCGLLAGFFYGCGFLRRRVALAVFGAVLAVVVYGGIVNPSSAFIWGGEALSFNMIASYWLSGLPMDALHAFATAAFLWVLSEPILGAISRANTDLPKTDVGNN